VPISGLASPPAASQAICASRAVSSTVRRRSAAPGIGPRRPAPNSLSATDPTDAQVGVFKVIVNGRVTHPAEITVDQQRGGQAGWASSGMAAARCYQSRWHGRPLRVIMRRVADDSAAALGLRRGSGQCGRDGGDSHCSRGLTGWWASRAGIGSAGCRDYGLGGLVEGSDARVLTASEQRRLPCRSGGSGRGSCGPGGESPRPGRCGGTPGPGSQPGPGTRGCCR
jgi:hypothetical protein